METNEPRKELDPRRLVDRFEELRLDQLHHAWHDR